MKLAWFHLCSLVLCPLLLALATGSALSQGAKTASGNLSELLRLEVGPTIPLPIEGKVENLWSSAAPDDPDRLLVCTFEFDVEHARYPSGVYTSLDAGNTWMRTFVDASSDFVTEPSCAAGTNDRAYFVTSASEASPHGGLRQNVPQHPLGSMEAFRSLDGGLTWTGPRRYPFVDWTSLVVANAGNQTEKVYLFGNEVARGWGDAGSGAWLTGSGMIAVSEDGLHFSDPTFPPQDGGDEKSVSFPINAFALQDGSILALFVKRAVPLSESSRPQYVLYKWDGKGYRQLSEINLPAEMHETGLGSMAVDQSQRFPGRVYAPFTAEEKNRSTLGLAISDDRGVTWRLRTLLQGKIAGQVSERRSTFASVAVNGEGVVGIEWQPPRECPMFSVSTDGGESISNTIELGSCKEGEDVEKLPTPDQSYLHAVNWTTIGFSIVMDPTIYFGGGPRLVADSAGRFHPFWSERSRTGHLVLLTAAIGTSTSHSKPPYQADLSTAEDLTSSAAIKVDNERLDSFTATFSADLSVQNREGDKEIAYPSFVEVSSQQSDCGKVIYLNPFSTSEDGKAIFRVPKARGSSQLPPGNRTLPVHIELRLPGCEFSNLGQLLNIARNHHLPNLPDAVAALQIQFRVLVLPAIK
jgi:hypothetical protein